MLSAARNVTLIHSGGCPVPVLTDRHRRICTGIITGIPVPIILFSTVFALTRFVLTQTRLGRQVHGLGGNPNAAQMSGLSLRAISCAVAGSHAICMPSRGLRSVAPALAGGVGRVNVTHIDALPINALWVEVHAQRLIKGC
ncbi:hypothetical protein [Paracoccus sp. Ld10]|uniref:hypothetical protein n=1 Tax=Paracoccus sp. Ld10 TaxID=649158 RepID=UPI003864FFC9